MLRKLSLASGYMGSNSFCDSDRQLETALVRWREQGLLNEIPEP